MNKIQRIIFMVVFLAVGVSLCAGCSKAALPNDVHKTASATRSYAKNTPEKAIDGDSQTGWVSAGIVSEINSPYFQLEFDDMVSVKSITINDDFANGLTTEVKKFQTAEPSVKSAAFQYTVVPNQNRTAIGVFSENSENGWECDTVPTQEAPQAFYGEFRFPIETDRIVVDNYENSIIPVSFCVYACEESVANEHKLNVNYEGWKKIASFDENDQMTVNVELAEKMNIRSVLYVVSKHSSSTMGACLRGLYLQQKLEQPDANHYPIDFNLLYSQDGLVYEIIEIRGNDSPVFKYEFDKKVNIKSIRYLPLNEYGGNKPSLGELIVE